MTRIDWDVPGSRHFSSGVDRGVLFIQNGSGVAWSGITAVNETPTDADVVEGYYDGLKFFGKRNVEGFSASIEAYTYPLEFEQFDGQSNYVSGQRRRPFGFSYRTKVDNDQLDGNGGHLIHIVYNAVAQPSEKSQNSVGSDAEALLFNWPITTSPILMGDRYGSHMIIDTRIAFDWAVEELENILYGYSGGNSRLPTPQEVIDIFQDASILKITDHGDGTWTAEGPDEAILMLTPDLFEITWPSAVYIDAVTYRISSL